MYISWWVYFVTGLSYVLQQPPTAGLAKTKADIMNKSSHSCSSRWQILTTDQKNYLNSFLSQMFKWVDKYLAHILKTKCFRNQLHQTMSLKKVVLFWYFERKMILQLNEYETAPYFIQFSQNMTCDCLLISVLCPEFTWAQPKIVLNIRTEQS